MLNMNKGKSCLYRINIDATVHYLFFNGNFKFQTQLINSIDILVNGEEGKLAVIWLESIFG